MLVAQLHTNRTTNALSHQFKFPAFSLEESPWHSPRPSSSSLRPSSSSLRSAAPSAPSRASSSGSALLLPLNQRGASVFRSGFRVAEVIHARHEVQEAEALEESLRLNLVLLHRDHHGGQVLEEALLQLDFVNLQHLEQVAPHVSPRLVLSALWIVDHHPQAHLWIVDHRRPQVHLWIVALHPQAHMLLHQLHPQVVFDAAQVLLVCRCTHHVFASFYFIHPARVETSSEVYSAALLSPEVKSCVAVSEIIARTYVTLLYHPIIGKRVIRI